MVPATTTKTVFFKWNILGYIRFMANLSIIKHLLLYYNRIPVDLLYVYVSSCALYSFIYSWWKQLEEEKKTVSSIYMNC